MCIGYMQISCHFNERHEHSWIFKFLKGPGIPWGDCSDLFAVLNSSIGPQFCSSVLRCPLLLLPSIFPSIRVLSNEVTSYQVAKVLELQLQHHSFQ